MLFNSYPFFILILITVFLYYSPLKKYQVPVLLVSSAIFYGYSQPYLLLLLFLSASLNAITSYLVFFEKNNNNRKIIAIIGVTFNLLVLAGFKYNHLLDRFVLSGANSFFYFWVALPLPIGISFYTFQGISLVMDVYKPLKNYNIIINRNFITHYKNTIFFISFFPQLVSGPIVKAHDFLPQITQKYFKDIDLYYVYKRIVLGYFLKIVIADNLKEQTFWIAAPYFESKSSLTLITMLFGYSMQIFADFAGYSLIAIGVAALFGYKLPENFNFPYISTSITEFWQRWHISLSSWLKEYLYIGLLGGNRIGRGRTYLNLMIVMFLGGLWHGAALSYGIWGLWHGIGLAIERIFDAPKSISTRYNVFSDTFRMLFIFSFVSIGWLLFKLPNIGDAIQYILAIWKNTNIPNSPLIILNILIYTLPVVVYHALYLFEKNKVLKPIILFDHLTYASLLAVIFINGGLPGAFVYFQF